MIFYVLIGICSKQLHYIFTFKKHKISILKNILGVTTFKLFPPGCASVYNRTASYVLLYLMIAQLDVQYFPGRLMDRHVCFCIFYYICFKSIFIVK